MEKEFVPYELAVKLKSLGFDEPCFGVYDPDSTFYEVRSIYSIGFANNIEGRVLSPTFSQAFRWFREKYELDSSIIREKVKVDGKWIKTKFYIYSITNDEDFPLSLGFDLKDNATYEEAELACLTMLIEIVELKSE